MTTVPGSGKTAFSFRIDSRQDSVVITISGIINVKTASAFLKQIKKELKNISPGKLVIDISKTDYDDYGLLALSEIRRTCNLSAEKFVVRPQDSRAKETIDNFCKTLCNVSEIKGRRLPNPIIHLGEATLNAFAGIRYFISFIGATAISLAKIITSPGKLRTSDVVLQMKNTGVDALPVIALISFLLGLIMAFMSSLQLQRFGANLYVASLVAMAMVSELGPIMTAIVVAGRSGSAYAAEIGTMKISEEIDALFVMGFDPNLFLVIPRLVAAVVVIPILTVFSDLFAIAGGLFIGVTMLQLSPASYIQQTIDTLSLFEMLWGLFKSSVFAVLIAMTGCLRGFQAKGGASAVGNAATSAVVTSIFLIILFDSIFAVIRSYW